MDTNKTDVPEADASSAATSVDTISVEESPGANSLALQLLAIVAVVYALDWAQSFFISLLLGILISYTLNPLVNALVHIKIPRALSVTVVMMAVVGGLVLATYSLRDQAQSIIEQIPVAATKLSRGLNLLGLGQGVSIEEMQRAANEMKKAMSAASDLPMEQPEQKPKAADSEWKIDSYLWAGSLGALVFMTETAMVLFLGFFLLLSGDTFKRKLVKLTGPSLTRKRITVHILEDINHSIQKYMFMLLVTNTMVGLMCWALFRWLGLDNAGAWALAAALLHLIPYFGPVAITVATGLAALLQFESILMMLSVAGGSLVIATFVGIFVTTWMTGRIAKMNPAAVFIALLFWGWLWGVWGMLLSIPIIVIVKVVSEHIEQLESLAELLGE